MILIKSCIFAEVFAKSLICNQEDFSLYRQGLFVISLRNAFIYWCFVGLLLIHALYIAYMFVKFVNISIKELCCKGR